MLYLLYLWSIIFYFNNKNGIRFQNQGHFLIPNFWTVVCISTISYITDTGWEIYTWENLERYTGLRYTCGLFVCLFVWAVGLCCGARLVLTAGLRGSLLRPKWASLVHRVHNRHPQAQTWGSWPCEREVKHSRNALCAKHILKSIIYSPEPQACVIRKRRQKKEWAESRTFCSCFWESLNPPTHKRHTHRVRTNHGYKKGLFLLFIY